MKVLVFISRSLDKEFSLQFGACSTSVFSFFLFCSVTEEKLIHTNDYFRYHLFNPIILINGDECSSFSSVRTDVFVTDGL